LDFAAIEIQLAVLSRFLVNLTWCILMGEGDGLQMWRVVANIFEKQY
jgi:hypothetical protein